MRKRDIAEPISVTPTFTDWITENYESLPGMHNVVRFSKD